MKKIGVSLLIISLIILLATSFTKITGNVIAEPLQGNSNYLFILGLILFLFSLLILTSKRSLDAIIIPTGPSHEIAKERARRAVEESEISDIGYFLISGGIEEPLKTSQQRDIYRELRKAGINPSEMKIEGKSKDTIENVLYSFERLKESGARDVGIASNPSHLNRFENIIDTAKKEGIIDKDFRIHRLETSESFGTMTYGILASILNKYKLRKGLKNKSNVDVPVWIKKSGAYIFNRSSRKK